MIGNGEIVHVTTYGRSSRHKAITVKKIEIVFVFIILSVQQFNMVLTGQMQIFSIYFLNSSLNYVVFGLMVYFLFHPCQLVDIFTLLSCRDSYLFTVIVA